MSSVTGTVVGSPLPPNATLAAEFGNSATAQGVSIRGYHRPWCNGSIIGFVVPANRPDKAENLPPTLRAANAIAAKIAKEEGFAVDDLYGFAKDKLKGIQRPMDVHFSQEGSKQLAGEVVESVREAMKKD
jgi:lysophospholipase L1-like esterase